jgi:Flp pilus assembly protein TadG
MGIRFRKPGRGHRRHGAAAVEFAVVAPLFLLLLAGIIEFGQAFRIQHSLSSAARRGARAAVIEGSTASGVIQKVKDDCVKTLGVAPGDVTVTISVNGSDNGDLKQAARGNEIRVNVSIAYSKAGAGFFANTFANSTISSTCILEHE